MKKRLGSPCVAIASVIVCLLGVEVFFRIFPGAVPESIEYLARARLYSFDRDIGVVLRPDFDARLKIPRLGREVRVRTRSHGLEVGFRDDGFQGGPRLAILGDSYVFGYGVDQDESFPAQLERKLRATGRKLDVVNAGVPGFSQRLERVFLEKYVLRLSPFLVIAAVYANDFKDSLYYASRRFGALRTFLGVHSIVYQLISAARTIRPKPTPERPDGGVDVLDPANVYPAAAYPIVREELERMHAICRSRGVRFAVIFLPAQPPIDVQRVLEGGSDFPILDLTSRFAGLPRLAYHNPYVGHLTPEANGWVADLLLHFLEEKGLLPPAAAGVEVSPPSGRTTVPSGTTAAGSGE
jgi:hypothetical protein